MLAYLIDTIRIAVVYGIGYVIMILTSEQVVLRRREPDTTSPSTASASPAASVWRRSGWRIWLVLAYAVWNIGYRQGTTGSSIGKGVMKFKVVSETTGQPIGFGMSVVRQLAHFVDAIICYVGFLFPLWDSKRQTLADKIMTTVCLPL